MKKVFKHAYAVIFLFLIVFLFTACEDIEGIANAEDFKEQTFFLYGKNYDRCIDSDEELQYFVWHTVLYQENNVDFYINMENENKTTINNKVVEAISEYPEYSGINVSYGSYYVKKDSITSIYTLINLDYYLNIDKVESEDIETYGKSGTGFGATTDQTIKYVYGYTNGVPSVKKYTREDVSATEWTELASDEIVPYSQDTTGIVQFSSTSNNRCYEKDGNNVKIAEFAIDSSERETYSVYNSEQLLSAVMYGKRPIFEDSTSVAYTIYQNAKTILRQINTDEMSDYEKVLNIYDYIIGHNTYDNTIIDFMSLSGNSYVTTFGNCAVFYLEGILYDLDHQYAVCDGISKAFALLCGIEGIECYKINGIAGGGNHAWNIVGFKKDISDTEKSFYFVDITWSDRVYSDSEIEKELPTHYYFLVDKEQLEIEGTRTYLWNPVDEETVDYDYYEESYLDVSQDINLLIQSQEELSNLGDYCRENDKDFVEFKLGVDAIDMLDGVVGNMAGSIFKFVDEENGEAPSIGMNYLGGRPVKSFEYENNTYLIDQNKVYIVNGTTATLLTLIVSHKFMIGLTQFIYAEKQTTATTEMIDSFLQLALGTGYSRTIFGNSDLISVWFV